MTRLERMFADLDPKEREQLVLLLDRNGCLEDYKHRLTCELEKALVYFFWRVNLLDHYITEPMDGAGNWCMFHIQAAMGADDFIRPFLEEAARWRTLAWVEPMSERVQEHDMYRAVVRDGWMPRAKDWRKWWARKSKDVLEYLHNHDNRASR